MAGLVPAIHAKPPNIAGRRPRRRQPRPNQNVPAWMAGTSPAMTLRARPSASQTLIARRRSRRGNPGITSRPPPRHGRACPGHPRQAARHRWTKAAPPPTLTEPKRHGVDGGTSPAMTSRAGQAPANPSSRGGEADAAIQESQGFVERQDLRRCSNTARRQVFHARRGLVGGAMQTSSLSSVSPPRSLKCSRALT